MVNNPSTEIDLWSRPVRSRSPIDNLIGLGFAATAIFTVDQSDDFALHLRSLKDAGKKPAIDYALVLLEEERQVTGQRSRAKVKVMRVFQK